MMQSPPNMQSPARRFVKALKYIYRFGALSGIRVFLRTLTGGSAEDGQAEKLIRLRLPGFRSAVLARPGSSDVPTFEKVFVDQEYNFDLPNFTPGLIIDAGANVGYASLFFARRFPEAKIIAIEPEAANFEMLTKNTAAYPAVQPLQAALWSRSARLAIANPEAESWEFQVKEAEQAQPLAGQLRAVTIQELIQLSGQARVSVLKLDIEGAEKELFASGSEDWLGLIDLIIIELHDRYRAGCSSTFYRALSGYEFGQFPMGENVFVLMGARSQL